LQGLLVAGEALWGAIWSSKRVLWATFGALIDSWRNFCRKRAEITPKARKRAERDLICRRKDAGCRVAGAVL
jgi:hypothetical protein